MNLAKVLLDTNILFHLEDDRIVPANYSELVRRLTKTGTTLFVHAASDGDVSRDKDKQRRRNSESKLAKYSRIEKSLRSDSTLESEFGEIKNSNDVTDCHLLAALKDGAVDALVTEDIGLHRRAERCGLSSRVYRVRQLIDILTEFYARADGTHAFIENVNCYQIEKSDPIFGSLKKDYPEFETWWQKICTEHRQCWTVRDNDSIAGLVVVKEEQGSTSHEFFNSGRILKLCTFKVSENHRGGRLGEQLLKQSIWYSVSSSIDVVYLTASPKQTSLLELLTYYGFQLKPFSDREICCYRDFRNRLEVSSDDYEWHRTNFPFLKPGPQKSAIIPIRPEFQRRLLPEGTKVRVGGNLELFQDVWSSASKEATIPATSIRKVYVCSAVLNQLTRGTRLYFYTTKNENFEASQSISAIGVLESYSTVGSYAELIEITGKRSVYASAELKKIFEASKATRVLNFILVCRLQKPLNLAELVSIGVLKGPPQSIMTLDGATSLRLSEAVVPAYLN